MKRLVVLGAVIVPILALAAFSVDSYRKRGDWYKGFARLG